MSYTYDFTNKPVVARIRLRINDHFSPNIIFLDEEIEDVYNNLERESIKRTSAYLLETIASNEAYVQKVITMLSLSTNGAAVAESLRKDAAQLRLQADEEEAFSSDGVFDIAEQVLDDFTYRELLYKKALAGA